MKIELTEEQEEILKRINAPYDPDKDYSDVNDRGELQEFITNYVVMHEVNKDQDVTKLGNQLLDIHDYIVENYDFK